MKNHDCQRINLSTSIVVIAAGFIKGIGRVTFLQHSISGTDAEGTFLHLHNETKKWQDQENQLAY